ncbi:MULTISPECIES: hypothetical protein [Deinococcus]|jgi:hypothetical protein|uniref:Uncharacterized protein n=1 Tax=Deinococcus radiodurans (strain ATCC 13939 / DSM 20539 / JCM 16871 / CCUG 27074 / LMG 4051 / NBRC 15346 / NCIMB 9279 / VKM B-1422 / R1) TaxID=243230 RepID=Q9RWT7_DEIRA|nr:hypothetical protein [Deinococcus radiodurans]AAF10161.1 hypothetical protein DR_0578 [Deinococcus radiodurans R1 = ATCC 13939 = DSM 20539]ANC72180.1 hypothetical protein A2G07_10595 [Deinococcus radiodurans R1 = ATCC 13939 = DSM 20539]QEM72526.1 hypothetical protein DXG80_12625 [Deinococcus radiodurans]QIP28752.1 hypothetical protein HAV23_05805 [Deinococcus radiodurans]QIP32544.1 hypothetical protein HAV35_10990 [Deinococcus radiodurans]
MKRLLCLALLLVTATASAGSLRGALIVASDGTFLGTCDGKYSATSIANDYGKYGNAYSATSMFNTYSQYGSDYGSLSAFNDYSSSAPYLLGADASLLKMFTSFSYRPTPGIVKALRSSGGARVSTNRALAKAIDPNVLRVACENP